MGSAAVEAKLQEIDRLAQKLNAFALSGRDKSRLLDSLGMVIEEQTKERFDTKIDPEGNEWRKLTDAYRKYVEKHFPASSILVREGDLKEIEHQLKGGGTVLIGSPSEHADYHQSAKSKKRRREFLGLSTDNILELQDAVDEFMKGKTA